MPGLITLPDAEEAQRSLLASSALLFIKDANSEPDFLERAKITGGDYFQDYLSPSQGNEEPRATWEIRCVFLGMSALVPIHGQVRLLSARREQDTTKLFEIGKEGLPLLLNNGANDGYLPVEMAYKALKQYFKNLELKLIERRKPCRLLENPTDVMDAIDEFAKRLIA